MLKAGVSIIDISPKEGVRLKGYPHAERRNTGIHDPLYATCLYLNNGEKDFLIVALDLIYFGKEYVKKLRSKFKKDIMFCATHTHSGPTAHHFISFDNKEDELDKEYISDLVDNKLIKLINEAMNNTFDAQIGIEIGYCGAEQGLGGNRRKKEGIQDPSVNVLAVKDKDDNFRACLYSYALHPTYLHADNTKVSADYCGYVRHLLSFAKPDMITMSAVGTCGNQSSRYFRTAQNFEEAARAGTTIGVEVNRCLDRMKFNKKPFFEIKSREIDLPLKDYPPMEVVLENLEKAKKRLEDLKKQNASYVDIRNAEVELFGAENAIRHLKIKEQGIKSKETPYEIQLIRIDDSLIVGLQGEIFVEYGLEIKKASPYKNTIVNAVTNGSYIGYIYTPEAYKEGGYEVGNSLLSEYAGEKILNTVKEMF